MKISQKTTFLVLILIVAIGFTLRVWDVQNNPPGFFADEATEGYNAYKILTTGRDEWGKPFPVLFAALNDYINPVYIYSSVPIIAIFGLSEFSVRLTSVIYGTLAIIAIYFLAKEMFNEKIGLYTALFLAISPWHIHESRIGFEVVCSVFWVALTFYLLYKALKNASYFLPAVLSFVASFFSYDTAKIYLFPLTLVFMIVYYSEFKKLLSQKRNLIIGFCGVLLILLLIRPHLLDGTFFTRWNQVTKDKLSTQSILRGYFNHFSSNFLFISGEVGMPQTFLDRTSIHGIGQLYSYQLPLIGLGFLAFFISKKFNKAYLFFLGFLLLYPLGTIFTTETPSANRSILGLIPWQIFSGLGLYTLFQLVKMRFLRIITGLVLFFIIILSLYRFLGLLRDYRLRAAGYYGWQYGFRQIMEYFKSRENDFDELVITHNFNVSEELLAFYNVEFNCNKCRTMNNPKQIQSSKTKLYAIRKGSIERSKINDPEYTFVVEKIIYLPNGVPEFYIGEFVKL